MTIQTGVVTGALGLMMFLAAGAGRGEDPARPDRKRPGRADGIAALRDTKAPGNPEAAAAMLESAYEGQDPPEAVRMLVAILRGSRMGPGEGWFGPADSRYSWKWLARRCGLDPARGRILPASFRGPEPLFARLDRNKDGVITPDDLDWSDRNPYVQMSYMANRLFRKLNAQGNGQLTKDELLHFFEKAGQGKDHLTADDFRDALLAGMSGGSLPGDVPKPAVLLRGLFAGELGSLNEGPRVNDPAPDFTLKTVDGKDTVHFGKRVGPKPVVLVFGSFT
jgi:hypothetical protein